MKYNDNSKYFKDWTIKKLKYEAIGYYETINYGCHGTKDIRNYDTILEVLAKRGVEPIFTLSFTKEKTND